MPLADVLVEAPGLRVEEVEQQVSTRAGEAALPDRRRRVRLLDVAARPGDRHRALLRRRGPREQPRSRSTTRSSRTATGAAARHRLGGEADRDRRRADLDRHAVERSQPQQVDDSRCGGSPRSRDRAPGRAADEPHRGRRRPPARRAASSSPEALAARQTSPLEVAWALAGANVRAQRGRLRSGVDRNLGVDAGALLRRASRSCAALVVNVVDGTPGAAARRRADRATARTRRRLRRGSASGARRSQRRVRRGASSRPCTSPSRSRRAPTRSDVARRVEASLARARAHASAGRRGRAASRATTARRPTRR